MVGVHTYTERKIIFRVPINTSYLHVLKVFTMRFHKKPLKCLLHVPLLLRHHFHPPVHWLEHVSLKTYTYEQTTNHISLKKNSKITHCAGHILGNTRPQLVNLPVSYFALLSIPVHCTNGQVYSLGLPHL